MKTILLLVLISISYSIDVSLIKGVPLFNTNTPIIINIDSPDTEDKKSNVDLVCVIDASGSMRGKPIENVKESLKKLIWMMDEKDRISLILFNSHAIKYLSLTYLTKENKDKILKKIDKIKAKGGTDILSGLIAALEILNENILFSNSASSVILLSDGFDNIRTGKEIADELRKLIRLNKVSFTLNTFGYGDSHDPKLMNELAKSRDGSFYYVAKLEDVQNYFINVLGECMSVIAQNYKFFITANYKIERCYGLSNLFKYSISEYKFSTEILQLIGGKEYTYVCEINIPDNIENGNVILTFNSEYLDSNDNKVTYTSSLIYTNNIDDKIINKSTEEYIRSYVYENIYIANQLREKGEFDNAISNLNILKDWIVNNYKGSNQFFLYDIEAALQLLNKTQKDFTVQEEAFISAMIREESTKRGGNRLQFSNTVSKKLLNSIKS